MSYGPSVDTTVAHCKSMTMLTTMDSWHQCVICDNCLAEHNNGLAQHIFYTNKVLGHSSYQRRLATFRCGCQQWLDTAGKKAIHGSCPYRPCCTAGWPVFRAKKNLNYNTIRSGMGNSFRTPVPMVFFYVRTQSKPSNMSHLRPSATVHIMFWPCVADVISGYTSLEFWICV